MPLTENDLAGVDDRLRAVRFSLSKKLMADAGSYSYVNPVTGEIKQGTISPEEQLACDADLASKLDILQSWVAGLQGPQGFQGPQGPQGII